MSSTLQRPVALASADTVAIVVHGVGDHRSGRILERARQGLAALQGNEVGAEEIEVPLVAGIEGAPEPFAALKIVTGEQTHFLLPVIWSRLRPRSAREAELERPEGGYFSRVFDLLFQATFLLLPSSLNAIRCIAAAPGIVRRLLVGATALLYAILAPGLAACGFFLVAYVVTLRAAADKEGFAWWRIPLMFLVLALVNWFAGKILMLCDFVGDVVAYVGNPSHRRKAEERLLRIIRDVARHSPGAQILVVGHSLGSVLVTHAVLRLDDDDDLHHRLRIITMGSPLRMMSWFFPDRIHSAAQLWDECRRRHLARSWANLWRDGDWIGRSLGDSPMHGYAETSLGDGAHADYWADPRCWQTVVAYLQSSADGRMDELTAQWGRDGTTEDEERELIARAQLAAKFAVTFNLLFAGGVIYFWHWCRERQWLATLDDSLRIPVLALAGVVSILVAIYYCFASRRVGGPGITRREMLARYRFNWSIAIACLKFASLLSVVTAFVLWSSWWV